MSFHASFIHILTSLTILSCNCTPLSGNSFRQHALSTAVPYCRSIHISVLARGYYSLYLLSLPLWTRSSLHNPCKRSYDTLTFHSSFSLLLSFHLLYLLNKVPQYLKLFYFLVLYQYLLDIKDLLHIYKKCSHEIPDITRLSKITSYQL